MLLRKALQKKNITSLGNFILIGDRKRFGSLAKKFTIIDLPYRHSGEGSLKFLDRGIELIKGGIADALVTAPLSKEEVSKYKKGLRNKKSRYSDRLLESLINKISF